MGEFLEADGETAAEAAFQTDAAGVGLAMDRARARRGGKGDEATDRFLAAQEALIAKQGHHLDAQFRILGLDHWSKRLRLALQALTILAATLALSAVGWMAVGAAHADGVVIKAFAVAPDLARRGVTGEVVASQLLDKLTDITDQAQSSVASGKFGAGWGQNISIQIPETGVSLGEVDRWLREKLGHERNLSGEIVQNPDGTVTLSTRLGAKALPPQTGAPADLSQLIARAAETLYRRESPMTYVQYLVHVPGRTDESIEVLSEMTDSRDPVMRAFGYGGLGNQAGSRGDRAAAVRNYQAADAENSGLSWPVANLASTVQGLGHLEEGLRLRRRALALTPRDPAFTPEAARQETLGAEAGIAGILHDNATVLAKALVQSQGEHLGSATSRASVNLTVASVRAQAHDGLRAEADATSFVPRYPLDAKVQAQTLASIALARGDWAGYLTRADAAEKTPPVSPVGFSGLTNRAGALARIGRQAQAEAAIGPTPLDCQPCIVGRGTVAEAAGRRAEADHWFAEASRMAPSTPNGPLNWGRALLDRGDAARAAVQFREALRRSPRAEEALEGLGEALLMQGDAAGAADQFAAADKLTPRWGRTHLKWGEALAKQGKRDEARAQFTAAAGLDLTAAERAELAAQKT